jgi:predicted transglutaminase-like cysteine proteinase
MRKIFTALTAAAMLFTAVNQNAEAGFIGMPRGLHANIERIRFDAPTLAPFAYTEFCVRYKSECRPPQRMAFRGGKLRMDYKRWAELAIVNLKVNAAIRPERYSGPVSGETWLIGPQRGDCNDYAVTKRHELIKRGWSPRHLLLSEVVIPSGEHHLVLVVRTKDGDLVLDNLAQQVRVWSRTPYKWVRIQRPDNEKLWSTIAGRNV